ncbi:hypothetical protein [Nocardia aobensis]|uniref:hypothetical protein n=1 Tax=Nocardia aobensis TaxID=257277 RepID=UPI0005648AED|nr:hypothetical protein [Nocardia aobensis]
MVVDIDCAAYDSVDRSLLVDYWPEKFAATGTVPELVQRLPPVRRRHAVPGVGMVCPDHSQ